MDKDQKDLPLPDPELPKPEEDLPLPEKEITAHSTPTKVKNKIKEKNPLWLVIIGGLILAIIIASIFAIFKLKNDMNQNKVQAITSFEECVAAGYPIMESYPEQCAANGQTFTRELSYEEKSNQIISPIEEWQTRLDKDIGYIIKTPYEVEFKSNKYFLYNDDNRKDTDDGFGPNLEVIEIAGTSASEVADNEIGENIELTPVTINNASGVQVNNTGGGFEYFLESEDGKIVRITYSTKEENPKLSRDSIKKMTTYAEGMLLSFEFRNENSLLDTNYWKTYEHETSGYALKYPDYLKVNCMYEKDEGCSFDGYSRGRGADNRISVQVIPINPEERGSGNFEKTIDEYLKLEIGESYARNGKPLELFGNKRIEDTTVDGIRAKVFMEYDSMWESPSPDLTYRMVIVPKNDQYYVISGWLEFSDITVEQFNKVLTTFRFTK